MQTRRIGCTNRRCQKLEIARSELVWCQSVKHRCGRQSTRTEGRSLAQAALDSAESPSRYNADLVRLPFEEIRRCRQTSSFVMKRFSSKSCRQSLRALLVWPVPRGEGDGLRRSLVRGTATKATWLILPVVICLSQRLSHACLSINFYTVKLRMAH